jgi:hypothetical protein
MPEKGRQSAFNTKQLASSRRRFTSLARVFCAQSKSVGQARAGSARRMPIRLRSRRRLGGAEVIGRARRSAAPAQPQRARF